VNCYKLDTLIELSSAFTLNDGVTPVDPTVVTLRVLTPDGVETIYDQNALTRIGVGVWTFDLITTQSGPYIYNWQGSGNIDVTSGDTYFSVAQSATIAG
jgi:hypothetical protein